MCEKSTSAALSCGHGAMRVLETWGKAVLKRQVMCFAPYGQRKDIRRGVFLDHLTLTGGG
ncbi:MAG: hypothetical protein RLZZ413_1237 [Pseudomonadota bacterium]